MSPQIPSPRVEAMASEPAWLRGWIRLLVGMHLAGDGQLWGRHARATD
jgi:hypothetical protein